MRPEDELSNESPEFEIIDLPEEDVKEVRGSMSLPTKDKDEQLDQQSIINEHQSPLAKTTNIPPREKIWDKQKRKINFALMALTILAALLLLNSAGGSLLISKMINTFTKQSKPSQYKAVLQIGQIGSQDTDNDLMSTLLRATPPGPPPTNCPSSPPLKNHQVTLIQHPFKIFGFLGPQAQVHLRAIQTTKISNQNLSAWGTQLILQLDAHDPPSIWLHMSNLNSGSDPIFSYKLDGAQAQPAMSAANGTDAANIIPSPSTLYLNPHMPDQNNSEAWSVGSNTWVTNVYFKEAGCYKLTAGWPDGHWEINFASGV